MRAYPSAAAHTRPVEQSGCYWIGRCHGGKGAGRRPSISRKIEQFPWHRDLLQLKSDIAAVARDLRANLDQLLAQGGQRPVAHSVRQGERAQEVAQVVRQGVQLKTHLVVAEAMAGKPKIQRPLFQTE